MIWGSPPHHPPHPGPLSHSTGRTVRNSQGDLLGGDRGGRVRNPPEVAGGEWGRLKHIIGHGAHFFLGWRWSWGHRERLCE